MTAKVPAPLWGRMLVRVENHGIQRACESLDIDQRHLFLALAREPIPVEAIERVRAAVRDRRAA
jgi:hypothetical protein